MLQRVDVSPGRIDEYQPYIGTASVSRLMELAEPLLGKRILHLNAAAHGSIISEQVRSTVALEAGLGLNVEWRTITGQPQLSEVARQFARALHGAEYSLTDEIREMFLLQSSFNIPEFAGEYDLVVAHGLQPLALRHLHGRGNARWVWRSHMDISAGSDVLDFLLPFIHEYDATIFAAASFVPPGLDGARVIPPGIDPLSPRNLELTEQINRHFMNWVGIDARRPVVTQVSRFDPSSDLLGVIAVYRKARAEVPGLQLALLGSIATDDPACWAVLEQVQEEVGGDTDITIATNLTGIGAVEVNVFQRASDVVIHKPIREGFGLTVSETLWKGTPVIASNVGGIPMQLQDGIGGYLIDPHDESAFAERIVQLFRYPKQRARLGSFGHDTVRKQYLITRVVMDELTLLGELVAQA